MSNNGGGSSSILRKNGGKNFSMGSASRTSLSNPKSILETFQSNSKTDISKRRSILSTPGSINRKRNSVILPTNNQSNFTSSNVHQTPQIITNNNLTSQITTVYQPPQQSGLQTNFDQRPLRDKSYQTLIQQEIYDFLISNNFETECNHLLTHKALKHPTQKDFILMFKFLYNKIDPYFEFQKSVEFEIFFLLKILNYPYLDSINRSQISAVGGQNWPSFLGVLYWLIKLNTLLMSLDIENLLNTPDDEFDKLFIKYIKDLYNAFINERDDYSEFFLEMKTEFKNLNQTFVENIELLDEENKKLKEQYYLLNDQLKELQLAEKKSFALEDDLLKLKSYIEIMKTRKSKWSEVIQKLNPEIINKEKELAEINEQKKQYELKIFAEGTSVSDIDNLNQDKDTYSKSIDTLNEKIDETKSQLKNKELDFVKVYQILENTIKQYNSFVSKANTSNHDFELKLNISILNRFNDTLGENTIINPELKFSFKPDEILNKLLKNEKVKLVNFKNEINLKIHQYQDENIKFQDSADLIREKLQEQSEYIEDLSSKITACKLNYDEIYETMINDSTTYSTQIEKLERELRSIKINANQGFIELENQYQNTMIEYDELTHSLTKSRQDFFEKCCKIAEFIMNFKLNIQTNLLDLDDLTLFELENEQKNSMANAFDDDKN